MAIKNARTKERKKKPDELLSSVMDETAVPAAVELLRSNEPFVLPNGTTWVMLMLEAGAIGGLSKRHSRDADKGSIVQLISSDQIQTVATAEMLNEEFFGIIPNEITLGRMDEFAILRGAAYAWAAVWQDAAGNLQIEVLEHPEASFADAVDVTRGNKTLRDVLGDQVWFELSGANPDAGAVAEPRALADEVENTDAPVSDEPFDDDEDPFGGIDDEPFDEGEGFDEAPGTADDVETDWAVLDEEDVASTEEFSDDDALLAEMLGQDDDPLDEGAQPPAVAQGVYADTVTKVRQDLARRFLSEDLDIEVLLDEFNASFAIGAPVVQIAIPEDATAWLGDQIAQLNRQMNLEIAQLHTANEDALRTLYVNMMSRHAERVIAEVSPDREGGRYKELFDNANRIYAERSAEKDQKIRERRNEIIADYEAQAKRIAEQAAMQAEVQFKERNRCRMEKDQQAAVAEIERIVEDDHAFGKQEILKLRKADADLKMQIGQSTVFDVLQERQAEYAAAEKALIEEWRERIDRLIAENRKADISRAEALAEQQSRVNEVASLEAEQQRRLDQIRREQAERQHEYEAELERQRVAALANLEAREKEWQHQLSLEKERTSGAVARHAELLKQNAAVEETVKRQYEDRIELWESERKSLLEQLNQANNFQSRNTKVMSVTLIALPLLTVVVGFIIGVAVAG